MNISAIVSIRKTPFFFLVALLSAVWCFWISAALVLYEM
jgi:hypothetical protein